MITMNWIACFNYSIRWGILKVIPALLILSPLTVAATGTVVYDRESSSAILKSSGPDSVPKPPVVAAKSAILPGWGQVINHQYYKIPLVYGALTGITYFGILQHELYQDYRAAYYNRTSPVKDYRFGSTPASLQTLPVDQLRFKRNAYRNRRDMSVVMLVAAWGLNVVDAYVFAHMLDFDVGTDLSVSIQPQVGQLDRTEPIYQLKISIPLTKQ